MGNKINKQLFPNDDRKLIGVVPTGDKPGKTSQNPDVSADLIAKAGAARNSNKNFISSNALKYTTITVLIAGAVSYFRGQNALDAIKNLNKKALNDLTQISQSILNNKLPVLFVTTMGTLGYLLHMNHKHQKKCRSC